MSVESALEKLRYIARLGVLNRDNREVMETAIQEVEQLVTMNKMMNTSFAMLDAQRPAQDIGGIRTMLDRLRERVETLERNAATKMDIEHAMIELKGSFRG